MAIIRELFRRRENGEPIAKGQGEVQSQYGSFDTFLDAGTVQLINEVSYLDSQVRRGNLSQREERFDRLGLLQFRFEGYLSTDFRHLESFIEFLTNPANEGKKNNLLPLFREWTDEVKTARQTKDGDNFMDRVRRRHAEARETMQADFALLGRFLEGIFPKKNGGDEREATSRGQFLVFAHNLQASERDRIGEIGDQELRRIIDLLKNSRHLWPEEFEKQFGDFSITEVNKLLREVYRLIDVYVSKQNLRLEAGGEANSKKKLGVNPTVARSAQVGTDRLLRDGILKDSGEMQVFEPDQYSRIAIVPNGPKIRVSLTGDQVPPQDIRGNGVEKEELFAYDIVILDRSGGHGSHSEPLTPEELRAYIKRKAKSLARNDSRMEEDLKAILESLRNDPTGDGAKKNTDRFTTIGRVRYPMWSLNPRDRRLPLKHPKSTQVRPEYFVITSNGMNLLVLDDISEHDLHERRS